MPGQPGAVPRWQPRHRIRPAALVRRARGSRDGVFAAWQPRVAESSGLARHRPASWRCGHCGGACVGHPQRQCHRHSRIRNAGACACQCRCLHAAIARRRSCRNRSCVRAAYAQTALGSAVNGAMVAFAASRVHGYVQRVTDATSNCDMVQCSLRM
ncbi:hypothetical protein XACJK2_390067 [Xanthomonas citri pv. citri]|nr:hypothetical protein XACJK2_390067 [Xanthomonas citri pv. citri]